MPYTYLEGEGKEPSKERTEMTTKEITKARSIKLQIEDAFRQGARDVCFDMKTLRVVVTPKNVFMWDTVTDSSSTTEYEWIDVGFGSDVELYFNTMHGGYVQLNVAAVTTLRYNIMEEE